MTLQFSLTDTWPADVVRILPTHSTPECRYEAMLPDVPQTDIDWLRAQLTEQPLKPQQLEPVRWPSGGPAVWLYGLPKPEGLTIRKMRLAVRDLISQVKKRESAQIALNLRACTLPGLEGASLLELVSVEAALATYEYKEFQTPDPDEPAPVELTSIVLRHPDAGEESLAAALLAAQAISDGLHLARDLGNRPANVLFPEAFAEQARKLQDLGLQVSVYDEHRLDRMEDFPGGRAGLLLAVGSASATPPRLVALEHRGGAPDQAPLVLVGKGITFDTGGLNVKGWKGMRDMYLDMMGAAAVLGAMQAIATMQLPVNVMGVCALAENAIGPQAMRPSDVYQALDGSYVEIGHTDAEGRLVLADALAFAVQRYQPAIMVDAATLTGSAVAALGTGRGAVLSKDDALADQILALGEAVGEPYWRLPMTEEYDEIAKSSRADVSNVGQMDPYGDAIAGAYFLHHFVQSTRWAHLDIAPIDHFDKSSGLNGDWSSGAATRIFIGLARSLAAEIASP